MMSVEKTLEEILRINPDELMPIVREREDRWPTGEEIAAQLEASKVLSGRTGRGTGAGIDSRDIITPGKAELKAKERESAINLRMTKDKKQVVVVPSICPVQTAAIAEVSPLAKSLSRLVLSEMQMEVEMEEESHYCLELLLFLSLPFSLPSSLTLFFICPLSFFTFLPALTLFLYFLFLRAPFLPIRRAFTTTDRLN